MTKHLLIISLFAITLASSCTSNTQKESSNSLVKSKEKKASKKVTAEKKKKEEYPTLTNETVVDFMTEYGKKNKENVVILSSRFGEITIKLYENTPLHRANFIYLTKRKYFDETQFYRVAKGFVCQAGNSDEWETQYTRKDIGMYTLPAELPKENIHKVGAVAAARSYNDNPEKLSSPYEFYITLGPTYNKPTVLAIAKEEGVSYTDEQVETYVKIGGQPSLDQEHTVFGEVIAGLDVVYEINKVAVDGREWPHEIVPIKIRIAEE